MFITKSNSYLLSGELMTNLTGRYVEIGLFTLSFSEYLEMHAHLGKPQAPEAQLFRNFLRYGGFPKALEFDDAQAKARYIELLVKAKPLHRCDRFDMKSKRSLQGGEKYHLADTAIYFARNVNSTMDYGPLLENTVYTYLRSRDYRVSVVQIGKLEVDSIARRADEGYAYIQVSLSVAEKAAEKREYRPFSLVRDNYPQYLLTLDPLPLERDGATYQNLVELMASGSEL